MTFATDIVGRPLHELARHYKAGTIPHSFMGGDPNVISYLITQGMSQTDAKFIADYDPIDKTKLMSMIATGMNPYDALTVMYAGNNYMPNVDSPPLASYRPPSYAPLPGYPMTSITSVPPNVTNPVLTTAAPATPATTASASYDIGGIQIPTTVFGIPTLLLAAGGVVAAFFVLKE